MTMATPSFDDLTDSQKMLLLSMSLNELKMYVDKHQKLLITGNGELPITERLRNLETFIKGIQFWFRTIAVALVLQTITFGAAAVIYFVKLTPLLDKLSQSIP